MSFFWADSNSLSGSLPPSWSTFTQMSRFYASSNSLSGSLPSSWWAFTQMSILLFRNNRLSGSLSSSFGNMTSLQFVDLGSNKLSGSFSTVFGAQSQLVFFAVDGNPAMDWSLSVFVLCSKITYLLMQNCSIRGTLPSGLSGAKQLDTLLLSSNLLSGTVPSGLLQTTPLLKTLVLADNRRMSGTLPSLNGGVVQNILMNGMRLSGSLPKTSEAKTSCPACPTTYLPCAMESQSHFCAISPNYPTAYGHSQGCTININAAGTLTATNFSTEAGYDTLSIGGVDYSGTDGPIGVPVQANTTVSWSSDHATNMTGWRLCWSSSSSEPALTRSLEVLSLARNYITGKTDSLEQESSLQTLLISANYLSCEAAGLDDATNLGQGNFEEPSSSTLKQAGTVLQGILSNRKVALSNPFGLSPIVTLPNTVLAFAGNPLMSRKAAILPPTEAGRLLQEDEIESGRRSLFPGQSNNLVLFMCCVLPGSVLFFGVIVAVSGVRGASGMVEFARSGLCKGLGSSCANHLLARSVRPVMTLVPVGLLCLIVDVNWSRGECIDFIVQTTIGTVQPDSTWQWFWVVSNCCASVATTFLLARLQQYGADPEGEHNQPQWTKLICSLDGAATKQAIDAWRTNMGASDMSLRHSASRSLISWVLHLPIVIIAMAPSVGYVFALNVPAGSGWYVSLLGNSLVVTIVNMLVSKFAFPRLSYQVWRQRSSCD